MLLIMTLLLLLLLLLRLLLLLLLLLRVLLCTIRAYQGHEMVTMHASDVKLYRARANNISIAHTLPIYADDGVPRTGTRWPSQVAELQKKV